MLVQDDHRVAKVLKPSSNGFVTLAIVMVMAYFQLDHCFRGIVRVASGLFSNISPGLWSLCDQQGEGENFCHGTRRIRIEIPGTSRGPDRTEYYDDVTVGVTLSRGSRSPV